ncbi:MAG: hemerythrin domain-containing protein [Rubrivivax sp.]|nr:hemerythrin domain-containing protein [Rubrivivax sp.]
MITPVPHDAPIQAFSNCHEGITAQLHELARLPALVASAKQARAIAQALLAFFRDVVMEHHAEEERELFPAVLASAAAGEEHDRIAAIVTRLTAEHRRVEAAWQALEPAIKRAARGEDAALDGADVAALVADYRGHAGYEEAQFLPLAQQILGRNSNHMAALGLSLHLRHAVPELLKGGAFRL